MDLSKRLVSSCVLGVLITQGALARNVEVIGSQKHLLKYSKHDSLKKKSDQEVRVLHVQLSDETKDILTERAQDASAHKNYFMPTQTQYLLEKVELGMNGVPVFNQGIHVTGITFAVTAAVDAILGKGDYVSPLCLLQLGLHLEKEGIGLSSWEGIYVPIAIKQMQDYGIINKETQHSKSCGGYYHYPAYASHPTSTTMTVDSYKSMSEPVFGNKIITTELPAPLNGDDHNPEQSFTLVKQALLEGERVVATVLLPLFDSGFGGAVGKHNTWFDKDTWVLTPKIIANARKADCAQALIITGYDDNAVATDSYGVKHKGLFTLRSSWGRNAGYGGDFYMSYDYFKLLTYDIQRFSPVNS